MSSLGASCVEVLRIAIGAREMVVCRKASVGGSDKDASSPNCSSDVSTREERNANESRSVYHICTSPYLRIFEVKEVYTTVHLT